jgi:hypothetical protein
MTTLTLVVAIVFIMTVRPMAAGSAVALATAIALGVLAAVPMWRSASSLSSSARASRPEHSPSSV